MQGVYHMKVKVLGSGQDAGIPHIGCFCQTCNKARINPEQRRLGPSIGLFDGEGRECYIIDASPDFKYQLDMVMEEIPEDKREGRLAISGIFLTHAHFGHTIGLLQLGKEALYVKELPVFCTGEMADFLQNNHPFRLLVERENIVFKEIYPDKERDFEDFTLIPFSVPHRHEVADCVGFSIFSKKSNKTLIYIPDTDQWTEGILERIRKADIALIDGTFYSRGEISRFDDVPHPPIEDTMNVLKEIETDIFFTHINHTNPINIDGEERHHMEDLGFKMAFDGMSLEL
jgi:pyrroloquinoline quinone biosynthesis protein B